MLAGIRAGLIDAVVVAQLDRLHRRPSNWRSSSTWPTSTGWRWRAVSGDVDLATDDARFMARIMGAVARNEMERKSWAAVPRRGAACREQRPVVVERPFGYARQPVLDDERKPVINKNGRRGNSSSWRYPG